MKILLKRIPFIMTIAFLTIFLSSCSSIIPDPAIKYAYIDVPFQSGLTYNGCGVASLAMVLEYYNMSISQEEIAQPILLGNRSEIREKIKTLCLENLDDITIIDPGEDREHHELYARELWKKRQRKGLSFERANNLLDNPNYYAIQKWIQ